MEGTSHTKRDLLLNVWNMVGYILSFEIFDWVYLGFVFCTHTLYFHHANDISVDSTTGQKNLLYVHCVAQKIIKEDLKAVSRSDDSIHNVLPAGMYVQLFENSRESQINHRASKASCFIAIMSTLINLCHGVN